MDKPTRSLIQNATQDARRLLEQEFREQLQGTFDIIPDTGTVAPQPGTHLDARQRFIRSRIVAAIRHERAKSTGDAEAMQGYLREAAFTTLNRFAALKLMEARRIVQECVSHGEQSAGFREFAGLAPGLATLPDHGYRLYLECLFDEIGTELGVLFDRRDPASLLWPRRQALLSLLDILNRAELAAANIWAEDETIGWIYQYFNDEAERRQMRDESAAPRNSRELAVRNQFFTPRYVVQFLSDNTLGRIWYEMTKGQTKLKDQCRYLIRRPNEIFLNPGETPPATTTPSAAKDSPSPPSEGGEGRGEVGPSNPQSPIANPQSQADLLRASVHIPHRPLKDPREIRMLDPACGSMHFGLYAFDLYEIIYDEAWDIAKSGSMPPGTDPSFTDYCSLITDNYPTKEAYLRDVPRLIIEHNIHGIDIDPRAVQIAGLSLWLRAQRSWRDQGVRPAERPPIRKSNVVCAEPMPGENEHLKEFCESLKQPVVGHMVQVIFDKMHLAGEAGSLLKIEEEIRDLIHNTKLRWTETHRFEQSKDELFSHAEIAAVSRVRKFDGPELNVDFSGITDETFWEKAEERIYAALRDYAEQAETAGSFQRRLFAEDAARGFAFIDICRNRYDVALMNPPFGDASLPSKPYIEDTYGDTKGDVYKAFVECFQARLIPAGYLGIISSRTGFFLGQSEDWRTRVVLRLFRPIALADLGGGVLDAMVEVAAYILRTLTETEARDLTLSLVPILLKVQCDKQDRFSLPKWQAARDGLKRHQAAAELEHLESNGFIQRKPGNIFRYTPLWHKVKTSTAPPERVFPSLLCIRLIDETEKGSLLRDAAGNCDDPKRFAADPKQFQSVPTCPFSYWVNPRLRRIFREFRPLESDGRAAKQGLASADDFRFLRLAWEVRVTDICEPEVHKHPWAGPYCVLHYRWFPFAKGGSFAPYYSDIHLLVDWKNDGASLRSFPRAVIRNSDFYFRTGITWPIKNRSPFKPWPLPRGCVFAHVGAAAFSSQVEPPRSLHALLSSQIFTELLRVSAGWNYEVGVIQLTPVPNAPPEDSRRLADLGSVAWRTRRSVDLATSESHAFLLPAMLAAPGNTLAERAAAWATRLRTSEATVASVQAEIDDIALRLYDLGATDRTALTSTLTTKGTCDTCAGAGEDEEEETASGDVPALTADLLAYALGCAFGRWDIRYATGEKAAPELPDPFAPLPICPPGMLQNPQGLPARLEDVPANYPLRITWSGILVDDPNHPEDIERRVREAIEVIWPDRPSVIESEACEMLSAKSLRDHFRKSFFPGHLSRYSKSRRQAPIYWPLSTPSTSYTIWLYYHCFTKDTFYRVQEFATEKLAFEERKLTALHQDFGPEPSAGQRKQLADQESFVQELRSFREEIARVAPLWNPDLNDGVIINFAPLWRLIAHRPWQKDVKACWDSLAAGEYDWPHLAMHLWPERVVPKCQTDRSLATAHGLDEVFWDEDEDGKPKSKKVTKPEIQKLITDRTSPAVKEALQNLLEAPTAGGGNKRSRK